MTKNQLDYLGLEEQKRNNLAVAAETSLHNRNVERETNRSNLANESIGRDRNAETKRNNLFTGTEQKRHNKATERISKTTPVKTTLISTAASKYAADSAAKASQYATNVRASVDYAAQANQKGIAAMNNKSAQSIAKLQTDTSKFLKSVDKLINDKNLKQRDRESLRKMATDLKINNDKLDADATQKELDRQVKMLTDMQGLISMLSVPGTAYSTDIANAGSKKAKANTKQSRSKAGTANPKKTTAKQLWPGVNTNVYAKSGATPAAGKTKTSQGSSAKTKIVINNKNKNKQQKSKGVGKVVTFTNQPLEKVKFAIQKNDWKGKNTNGKWKKKPKQK